MKNRFIITNNEVLFILTVVFLSGYSWLTYMDDRRVPIGSDFSVKGIIFAGIIFSFLLVYYFFYKSISRKLPADCGYNLFGLIELHISDKAEKGRSKFIRICIEATMKAHEEKRDVIFSSWLIKPEHLKIIFGDAIEIYRISLLEKLFLTISRKRYGAKDHQKNVRCIIRTQKLEENTLKKLNDILAGSSIKTLFS